MQAVKVLPKGQITLPKKVRKNFGIKEGDSLVLEEEKGKIVLKKGKTIFDFIGFLPNLGMSIEEMREKAIEEVAKERAEGIHRHKRNP
ncbi:MAG: AbrB/MazE/SpoVT family DNA-binding domain-containing protein [Nitrospirae bacterium]|nr:AbrB/MazE/SpoVT family DNA-binding domain-containing protein [Nitrospirota bacterium]